MLTKDKDKISYWEDAKIGDLIQLSDEQTIEYLMEQGCKDIDNGADFEVKRIRNITAQEGPSRWILMDIAFKNFVWFVVVKTAGSDADVKVFYIPDDFTEGSRQDALDADFNWLFEEPDDPDDLDPMKLSFTPEFDEDDGNVVFKNEGIEYGECVEGNERSFATIVEYLTTSDVENPEMMIFEYNNMKEWSDEEESEEDDSGDVKVETRSGVHIDEENSFMTLMQGCKVNLNDIKLLK